MAKSALKALDDLKQGLESLYGDLEECDITETNFKEKATELVDEWIEFAIRKSQTG